MAELVLPHSIDAGTEIVAAEHQANYVAIRDSINGQLEGGGGSGNNFKANGVTARELADNLLKYGIPASNMQEGVVAAGDLKVTPGTGLVLNYASGTAWVTDDSGVLAAGALLPVVASGSTVTIAANASGNPRIDQIILTVTGHATGTVSILQGTATGGATLDNRTGAAALPNDAIRLADILMPNGFAGPFVQGTHIRDRRPWARGAAASIFDTTGGDLVVSATAHTAGLLSVDRRVEFSGNAVTVLGLARFSTSSAVAKDTTLGLMLDGSTTPTRTVVFTSPASLTGFTLVGAWRLTPAELPAGSHLLNLDVIVTSGNSTLNRSASRPFGLYVVEDVRQDSVNSGA